MMKKRLKGHKKKQKLMQNAAEGGSAVDFEATCEEYKPSDFHHEISEFNISTHISEFLTSRLLVCFFVFF